MRCPRCGDPLSKIDRGTPRVGIDPDGALFVPSEDGYDMSEHWECHNEACDLSSPCYFVVHHPFHGTASAPGDSWSISWIK